MDRRRDGRYKQESHHYDERYNATYDNYDYEEDYGNQYANTVSHHHHPLPHPHAHPHHPEDHGYDDEEDHWSNQQGQQDFYDTVPATNIPPPIVKPITKSVARVQISTSVPQMDQEHQNIPQAPPPPRFGPSGGYGNTQMNNNNNNNDRKVSKYGNMATTVEKRRDEVHIRFDPGAKREFPPKQTAFIDGFRSQDALPVPGPKKKETGGGGGQSNNTIRSIINNLKGGGQEKQEDTVPRNRVSTNPFIRANQQQLQNQNQSQISSVNQRYEPPTKNHSKNVAEVVEKMNNGDWPIQIDDEESAQDTKRSGYQQPDKARQWETLHRKKDEKRSIVEDPIVSTPPPPPLPSQQPPPQQLKQQHPQMQTQREDSDEKEDEQQTSVSTDSALCSENSDLRGPSPYKLPFEGGPQKTGELAEEAEKLLFYFKGHKEVLNYLGIGLTDRLWKHVQKLPHFEASIRVFKKHEEQPKGPAPISQNVPVAPPPPSNIPPAPKITISQSFAQPDRKSPIGHQHTRSVSQNEVIPSPPQTQNFPVDESRFTKNVDGNVRNGGNNGGRFVKKSAAALIAKKQGQQTEDPNSATDIIDPRIAEEIKNLRDREEELKRSRSELALLTSPPPSSYQMSPTKKSPNGLMRNAQSFDHLDNPMGIRSPIERSHSSHNVYHLKNVMQGGESPYHQGNGYGNGANYGSMPRAQHRKDGAYQSRDHRVQQEGGGGYRQSRNGDFFRQAPTASEATNAGWQKSTTSFETKSSVASSIHSGLQLPTSGISISAYQQRSVGDKYQNPKSMYKPTNDNHSHRKIGL